MPPKQKGVSFINNTGGTDLLIKHFKKIKFWEKIDSKLGKRNSRAQYSYSDALQTWTMNMLTGSKRLEHSCEHSFKFDNHPDFKQGMSPDTISRTLKKLSCDNIYYSKGTNKSRHYRIENPNSKQILNSHEINCNFQLNELLLDSAISLGLFNTADSYIIDIDATILPTKVSDGRPHYKLDGCGYCPMVVFFGGIPIYIEMRNGNSSPSHRKKEVLEDAINLFTSRGLKVNFVRIDAAGYNKYIVNYLESNFIKYYIRAKSYAGNNSNVIAKWSLTKGHSVLESNENVATLDNRDIRLVEYRRKTRLNEEGLPKTWGIITNDLETPEEKIIEIYNQRGVTEQRFADLKEIGWHYMVHRELKYNTVHVMVTMLTYLIFLYSKQLLAKKLPFIKESFQPKTFIKKFILVLIKWVRGKIKFISRQKEFEPLLNFT